MTPREPGNVTNLLLQALIRQADLSHASLARQINQLGRHTAHLELRYDSSSVNRWLRGAVPSPPTPTLIADVLTRRIGTVVTPESVFPSDVDFLRFASTAAEAVHTAIGLWRHSVQRRHLLRYSFATAASLDAAWQWCFTPAPVPATSAGARRVGRADVQRLVTARGHFAALDRQHGGGHARTWLADYLDREAGPLLNGTYRADTGRALFSAVAVLTEMVSYMAFDDEAHGLSQRYSINALALAKHAGDTAYGAYIMSNMAAQHAFLGDGAKAAQLARAAWSTAPSTVAPALLARIHTTEARGHALTGDNRQCLAALDRAEQAFARAELGDGPDWLGAATAAHHAGSTMHCLYDLRRYDDAARYADPALELPADSNRARALHQILLARVQAARGDVDQSCATARAALHATPGVRSRRLLGRIRQYTSDLTAHHTLPAVRDWSEESTRMLDAAA